MAKVKQIAEGLKSRVTSNYRAGMKAQLKEILEEGSLDKILDDGRIKYDYGRLSYENHIYTDSLLKELDLMVLREKITEDEREDIIRLADLY